MSRAARLTLVGGLNASLVVALLVVGVTAHSLGVLAAGVDYLTETAAIAASVVAVRVSPRCPRAPTVAATVNAAWLVAVLATVAVAAIDRLAGGVHHVSGLPVLVVSAIAAVVMAACALVLDNDDDPDLNVRAVLLDSIADGAAAAGVAAAGGVILGTGGWYWLDPAVALGISVVVAYHAAKLLRDVIRAWRHLP